MALVCGDEMLYAWHTLASALLAAGADLDSLATVAADKRTPGHPADAIRPCAAVDHWLDVSGMSQPPDIVCTHIGEQWARGLAHTTTPEQ